MVKGNIIYIPPPRAQSSLTNTHGIREREMLQRSFSNPRNIYLEKMLLPRNCLLRPLNFQWAYFVLACFNHRNQLNVCFRNIRYTLLSMTAKPAPCPAPEEVPPHRTCCRKQRSSSSTASALRACAEQS